MPLFICLGNVARSQMAEAYYNHYSKSTSAISAGVVDHPISDRPLPEVQQVMREEGIDISQQRSKSLTPAMLSAVDSTYVLCARRFCPSYLLNAQNVVFWDIPDPYQENLEIFRRIRDLIKRNVLEILKK